MRITPIKWLRSGFSVWRDYRRLKLEYQALIEELDEQELVINQLQDQVNELSLELAESEDEVTRLSQQREQAYPAWARPDQQGPQRDSTVLNEQFLSQVETGLDNSIAPPEYGEFTEW